ncbi:hypothetical protein PInf_003596 [Phytophthora infestans]|nr:hypothetical protein PInf_003596 [Phytophthora infestans]
MAVVLKVYSPELLVTSTKPLLPCSTLSLKYLLLELVLATAELQITMVVACGRRGQIATPQRRQPGSADTVDIVSSQDGGSGSGGGRRRRSPARLARLRRVADESSRQDIGRTNQSIATPEEGTNTSRTSIFRSRTLGTPTIEQLYVKKLVAFSASKEPWMTDKVYRCVGTAYIVGRVCRRIKKPKNGAILQLMWLDSQFRNAVEAVTVAAVQRGIENHQALVCVPNQPAWQDLTDKETEEELNLDAPLDELEVASAEGEYESYDPKQILPVSLAEVEAVKNMCFEPDTEMEAPADLYEHPDDSTAETRLLPAYDHLFAHSASLSFFASFPSTFGNK